MGEQFPTTMKGYLSQSIVVWDLPTRIFKWSLVLTVVLAFLFSSSHPHGSLFIIHVACGYVVGLLLLFRLAWGFVGGPHARFRSFMYGWKSVRAYTEALLRLDPPRTTGHNPVGGWMIVAMLATLSIIVVTGLLAEGRTGGAGRLSALLPRDSIALLGDLHAWLGFVIMWIAAAHVAGVLFESLLHRENLVRSMLTGRKEASDPNKQSGQESLWRAAFLLIVLVALGAWLAAGTRLPPAR
jgi:cytochrome b